jgi:hypothetical protein
LIAGCLAATGRTQRWLGWTVAGCRPVACTNDSSVRFQATTTLAAVDGDAAVEPAGAGPAAERATAGAARREADAVTVAATATQGLAR